MVAGAGAHCLGYSGIVVTQKRNVITFVSTVDMGTYVNIYFMKAMTDV